MSETPISDFYAALVKAKEEPGNEGPDFLLDRGDGTPPVPIKITRMEIVQEDEASD